MLTLSSRVRTPPTINTSDPIRAPDFNRTSALIATSVPVIVPETITGPLSTATSPVISRPGATSSGPVIRLVPLAL